MRTPTRFKAAYVALAALDTWLSGAPPRWKRARVITKPMLMPVLAARLVTDPSAARSPLLISTLAGQAFGWGGDVGLLGRSTNSFLVGTASFGAGHLSYIRGFVSQKRDQPLSTTLGARAALTLWALTAPPIAFAAGRKEKVMGPLVLGYSALLASMFANASNLDQPATAKRLTALGAALFLASDTTLGVRDFVLTDAPAPMERGVMATYTAAQFLLAEGAARSR